MRSNKPHVQLHDDRKRYFCPQCQCPSSFTRAELLFCEQKDMPMVRASVHEDSSVGEELVPGDGGEDGNVPGLTFTLLLDCGICKQRQMHEILVWDPWAG